MFTKEVLNPFYAYSLDYWGTLILTAILLFIIIYYRDLFKNYRYEKQIRYFVASWLMAGMIFEKLWDLYLGQLTWDRLPLSLCSISAFMAIHTLFTKSERSFELLYFTGIAGGVMALLMPELTWGFPHITYINYYEKHIFVVLVPIYMMAVHGLRPTMKSYKRTMLTLFCAVPFIIALNWLTGANHWYLASKPTTPSIMDFMGQFPFSLIPILLTGLLVCYLTLLPSLFIFRKKSN